MNQEGAASVLVAAVAAVVLLAVTTMAAAGSVVIARTRLQGTADAAALAAAAALAGRLDGVPCRRAAELARMADARVASCSTRGLTARVAVVRQSGAFALGASAVAGQRDESAIYRYSRGRRAQDRSVYGVPVGSPTNGIGRRRSASDIGCGQQVSSCTNDQGVTCQARRSS